jgi:hypothetical protein
MSTLPTPLLPFVTCSGTTVDPTICAEAEIERGDSGAPNPRAGKVPTPWWRSCGTVMDIHHPADKYEILDVPNEARSFSSALNAFGKTFDKSGLESDISWAPGPRFQDHGLNEYIVLDANAGRGRPPPPSAVS